MAAASTGSLAALSAMKIAKRESEREPSPPPSLSPPTKHRPSRRTRPKMPEPEAVEGPGGLTSLVQEFVTLSLRIFAFRIMPPLLVVGPSYYMMCWLADPSASVKTVVVLTLCFTLGAYTAHPDKTWKIFSGLAALLTLLLGLYSLELVSGHIFVYVTSVVWVIGCILMTLLSAFHGTTISNITQQLSIILSFITPMVTCCMFFMGADHVYFRTGAVASLTSSMLNVFFNKYADSVGIPTFSPHTHVMPKRLSHRTRR